MVLGSVSFIIRASRFFIQMPERQMSRQYVPTCLLVVALVGLSGCPAPESVSPPSEPEGSSSPGKQSAASGASSQKSKEVTSALPVEFVAPALTEQEIRDGWISLFDGKSLFGWVVPTQTNWHVEDGAIVADSGEKSLLLTPYVLDDFELRCSFHLAAGGNSGLFLRTAPNAANPATDTYELNICDSHATHKSGSLVARYVAENVPPVEGGWHDFRVLCEGPRIQVWLDEKQIVDFTDTTPNVRLSGQLGLQMNQGRAAYKNVYVRPLSFRKLFNGTDTSGWRPVPGSKSEFAVKEGLLHVSGGPGFLETEEQFQDFALKVTARINGDGLNGGVFFRALPGTEATPSHGYEMQLSNGTKSGDRTQPADFGTGAIFRRTPARYVVADDRNMFTAVLIAQGDQFVSWVNGYQVVSWQDTRKDSDNPREGRKVAAGHLSLQGHDPKTDLDFESIDIHPLNGAAKP